VATLRLDPATCVVDDFAPAVAFLRAGGVVAFPTDTFYGLAVDPASAAAVTALFDLKGRDASAAIPFVAGSRAQVDAWCALEDTSALLADAFWPGPLSLICVAPPSIVPSVHASRGTVAVRVPAHAIARTLALAWGSPLPATSANRSGEPPAREASDLASLDPRHLLIIDGGPSAGGAASTIVDARHRPPTLIREGAIAWNRVLDSIQR
jgi:L-threonylcarbamoyladenylate synthase